MRTTSSFKIFANPPAERDLARARWLRSTGEIDEAIRAYRNVITKNPSVPASWIECFDLLRTRCDFDAALQLANDAATAFPNDAFPLALQGAALVEVRQYPDALEALERAVQRDSDLALTWHEMGYAAFRMGETSRALAALDRAFTLEPHTATLILRGQVLREAGELYAAEVAFEGALSSAEYDDQRDSVKREIMATRRRGAFNPSWVRPLTPGEQCFATHGTTVLASEETDHTASDRELLDGLAYLVKQHGVECRQVATERASHWAQEVALRVQLPLVGLDHLSVDQSPLILCMSSVTDLPADITDRGTTFALDHDLHQEPRVDVVGALTEHGKRIPGQVDHSTAVLMAQHPSSRCQRDQQLTLEDFDDSNAGSGHG